MTTTWTVLRGRITEHRVPGKPLGRHIEHDSRSWAYRYVPEPGAEIASVIWPRHMPILNQLQTSSCTGNAETGALATGPLWDALPPGHVILDEAEALDLYSAAEIIDGGAGLPAEDAGSSGLSVSKAAKNAGLISGYQSCFSLTAALAALGKGPVITGVNWYDSFDTPASNGLITISPGAQVRGGHEFEVRAVDAVAQTVLCDNSWGTFWGVAGSFTMGWATWERLLAEQGDVTRPVPLSAPAPIPAPLDPDSALWAVAGPWSAQFRSRPDLIRIQGALKAWAAAKHL